MPLTKRQFELEIDEEIENWMRGVYDLLVNHRDLAYSDRELRDAVLGEHLRYETERKFLRALEVLVEIEAIEARRVHSNDYFAFLYERDIHTWKRTSGS